jgi:hypothetical protein
MPELRADPGVVKDFLDRHFGHIAEPGLIEIAFGMKINRAKLFDNTPDGRIEAANFAVQVNRTEGNNAYFAPGLRKLDSLREKRNGKKQVVGAPMVWADFDDKGAAEIAKPLYEGLGSPHSIVVTGRKPAKRVQGFWKLDQLVTDQDELDAMLAGVYLGLGSVADAAVVNADRVMRLPGCISWPKPGKKGREVELTEYHTPGTAPAEPYTIESTKAAYPPGDAKAVRKKAKDDEKGVTGDLLATTPQPAPPTAPSSPPSTSQPPNPLQSLPKQPPNPGNQDPIGRERTYDMLGRRIDGRDEYAMQIIGGAIRNLAATFDRWPTADELFLDAWPTYAAKAGPKRAIPGEQPEDGLEREARGRTWFWDKCGTHIRRAQDGAISGMETIERAKEQAAIAAQAAPGESVGPPAPPSPFGTKFSPPKAFSLSDFSTIPKRAFLYGKHYIREYCSVTIAPGGVGKSTLVMIEGLAMATGRPLLGHFVKAPLRVAYFNLEDPLDEIHRRIAAALIHYKLTTADTKGRFFALSGRDQEVKLAADTREGTLVNEELLEGLLTFCKDERIDVLIFDPFVSSHGVNENDNNAIDLVVKRLAKLASEAKIAVEIVHHSRKKSSGDQDRDTTDDDARGAGSLSGASRSNRSLNRMSEQEAKRLGIPEALIRSYVKIGDGKQNMSPPAEVAEWYHLEGVELPNAPENDPLDDKGDHVAIVTRWAPPDPFDGITLEHANAVRSECGEKAVDGLAYRVDAKSENWIGHLIGEICDFDVSSDEGAARAKYVAKIWLKNGVLEQFDGKDKNRNSRPCYRPGRSQ